MKSLRTMLMISLLCLQLCFCGCFWLFVGGVGAVGGYAISRDTIQGEKDASYEQMWQAANRVANIMGAVTSEDETVGRIELEVDASRVKIFMEQLTHKTVRLRVTARKYLMPNIDLAQKIFIKITNELDK